MFVSILIRFIFDSKGTLLISKGIESYDSHKIFLLNDMPDYVIIDKIQFKPDAYK